MFRRFLLLRELFAAVVLCFLSNTLYADYRDFTNLEGKKLSAKIIAKKGESVTLERESDKRIFTLKVSLLSQDDQTLIQSWEPPPLPPNPKLYPKSKEEIEQRISEIRARKGSEWADPLSVEGVNQLNCYRYLCGVPDDVVLDEDLCAKSQKAADVMAKLKRVSHSLGEHTDACNLCPGASGPRAINAWFAEVGQNNLKRCGHRRWCLSPLMGKTGLAHKSNPGRVYNYSSMWALDRSRKSDLKFWTYPGQGFYPVDFMSGDSWSAYYSSDIKENITDIEIRVKKLSARPKDIDGDFDNLEGVLVPLINKFRYINSLIFRLNYQEAEVTKEGVFVVDIKSKNKDLQQRYLVELYAGPER